MALSSFNITSSQNPIIWPGDFDSSQPIKLELKGASGAGQTASLTQGGIGGGGGEYTEWDAIGPLSDPTQTEVVITNASGGMSQFLDNGGGGTAYNVGNGFSGADGGAGGSVGSASDIAPDIDNIGGNGGQPGTTGGGGGGGNGTSTNKGQDGPSGSTITGGTGGVDGDGNPGGGAGGNAVVNGTAGTNGGGGGGGAPTHAGGAGGGVAKATITYTVLASHQFNGIPVAAGFAVVPPACKKLRQLTGVPVAMGSTIVSPTMADARMELLPIAFGITDYMHTIESRPILNLRQSGSDTGTTIDTDDVYSRVFDSNPSTVKLLNGGGHLDRRWTVAKVPIPAQAAGIYPTSANIIFTITSVLSAKVGALIGIRLSETHNALLLSDQDLFDDATNAAEVVTPFDVTLGALSISITTPTGLQVIQDIMDSAQGDGYISILVGHPTTGTTEFLVGDTISMTINYSSGSSFTGWGAQDD